MPEHETGPSIRRARLESEGQFGEYMLERLLGESATTTVYSARDNAGRRVALKMLTSEAAKISDAREEFLALQNRAKELGEKIGVPVVSSGESNGTLYFATSTILRTDLAQTLRRGRLEPSTCIAMLRNVATVIDHAHHDGVIHGNLKPSNILFDANEMHKSRSYVVDFAPDGVVRNGTYCAPEIGAGGSQSKGADVYSFACIAFECLTGVSPFAARLDEDGDVEFPTNSLYGSNISDLAPELPNALDDVFARAMDAKPNERFGTCGAFVSALAQALDNYSPKIPEITAEYTSRNYKAWVLIIVALVLIALGFIVGALLGQRQSGSDGNGMNNNYPPVELTVGRL